MAQTARSVYLALDADRSGQEAMLRASRAAADRGMELRVVDMPQGSDPAELVAGGGANAFDGLVESASTVVEFQVRRVLADSDLKSSRGRDRALEEVRPLIATIPENTATRDELVRYVADRLDVPAQYLMTQLATALRPSSEAPRPARGDDARAQDRSLDALRLVRDHLIAQFSEPLSQLPDDDPAIAATITEVVMLADEEPSSEPALRLGFLQLELRRVERELRHAERADDFDRQRELWSEREDVRQAIGHVMGEAP
jgi:DNA primase